jgi:hypothetical protein
VTAVPGFRKETRPCAWCGEDVWVDAILDHECVTQTPEEAIAAQAQEDRELLEQWSGVHPASTGPLAGPVTRKLREATWEDLFGQRVEMARQHLEEMGFVFDPHWLEDTLRRISMEEYVRSTVEARARLGIAGITDA